MWDSFLAVAVMPVPIFLILVAIALAFTLSHRSARRFRLPALLLFFFLLELLTLPA